jgi:hypothetical protein
MWISTLALMYAHPRRQVLACDADVRARVACVSVWAENPFHDGWTKIGDAGTESEYDAAHKSSSLIPARIGSGNVSPRAPVIQLRG